MAGEVKTQRHKVNAADEATPGPDDSFTKRYLRNLDVHLISQSSISCVHAKLLQLCPTLCNPMDYQGTSSPPGSPVHRILPGRVLE